MIKNIFLFYCLWFCVNQATNTPELNLLMSKKSDSENQFHIPVHVTGSFEKKNHLNIQNYQNQK